MKKLLLLIPLVLNVSCSAIATKVLDKTLDIAMGSEEEPKHTIIENRNVVENREVKVVNINVSDKSDLKHSDDVQLGQKKVFFYPQE